MEIPIEDISRIATEIHLEALIERLNRLLSAKIQIPLDEHLVDNK